MREQTRTRCATHQKASSVNAGRIERASHEVEKRSRTSRSWFEGVSVERVCKVMPNTVLKCAWQITRRLARPGRVKRIERPFGRIRNRQVSEFTKLNHSTEPQKADEWSLRLWRDTVTVSSGHWRGTLARVRRCRPIWKRPESQRWSRKLLAEMDGEPWNTSPRQEEKLQIQGQGVQRPETTDQEWRTERMHDVLQACWSKSAGFANTVTGHHKQ